MIQGLLGKTALNTHTVIFFLKTILKNGGNKPTVSLMCYVHIK